MVNTFRRNIRVGLGVSLTALIISSTASYISIQKLLESDFWVDHTFKVIQDFDYILSRMKDAETGQRGYLLAGDPVFLEPYNGAKDDVQNHVEHVQRLTSDNLSQQEDFSRLEQLIGQKYALIDRTIEDRKRERTVTTQTLLEGKHIMDNIREQIRKMKQREQNLLAERTSKVSSLALYTPILILLASIIAIVITYVFYRRMKANLQDNQDLQYQLERKEADTKKQIKVISELAEQISKGNYDIRIKDTDL